MFFLIVSIDVQSIAWFGFPLGCNELSARHDRFCVKTGSRCHLNGLESQSTHFLLGEDRRRREAIFLVFSLGKSKEKHLRKSTWGCSPRFFSEMMFVMKGNTLRNTCFFFNVPLQVSSCQFETRFVFAQTFHVQNHPLWDFTNPTSYIWYSPM